MDLNCGIPGNVTCAWYLLKEEPIGEEGEEGTETEARWRKREEGKKKRNKERERKSCSISLTGAH